MSRSRRRPNRGPRRSSLAVAGVLALAIALSAPIALAPAGSGARASQTAPTRVSFTWELDDRFGLDADGDGLIEIENTAEYAHQRHRGSCPGACPPVRLWTTLTAAPAPGELGLAESGVLTYEWRLGGPGGSSTYHRTKPLLRLLLPEGRHDVDLRVRVRLPWGSITLRSRGTMMIDDLLVAALGDSYPSGEGSPDSARDGGSARWADATDPIQRQAHDAAHRSTVAWPARVALALEDSDRHTSVTFVDLAASGALIDRGLLGPRATPAVDAQLDELARIVQERTVDIMLVQVGGNDAGFSRVISGLVAADPQLNPICYEVMLENVWAAAADGIWDRGVAVRYDPPFSFSCRSTGGRSPIVPGLDGLGEALDRLARGLERLDVGEVYLVEYPDPTGRATGETCDEIVGDVTAPFPFHEVDEAEQGAGITRMLQPLNRHLEQAADRHGWHYVGGVSTAFARGHGYCAPWPDYGYPAEFRELPFLTSRRIDFPDGWYRTPGRYGGGVTLNQGAVSWYRTAAQSARLQGPAPRFLTSGTLHPNELGHLAIARIVLDAID